MTGRSQVTIRLAAIQARSLPGQIQANLDHAAGLVEQAAAHGASIVVLPELFGCGYVPNRAVWQAAEVRSVVKFPVAVSPGTASPLRSS